MHDIRAIRENPSTFDAAMIRLGISDASSSILVADEARRTAIQAAEAMKAEGNAAAKEIGAAKAAGDTEKFERLRAEVADKKKATAEQEQTAKDLDAKLRDILMSLPNLPYENVPEGKDEYDNVELHRWGTPPAFDFSAKEHFEIKGVKGGMDFETAAKLSGSRFVIMSGAVARVHRALAQFMLDTHTMENGLIEVIPPILVRDEAMYGTNQLPKFAEDSYQTRDGMWLIPTSEVSLTNIVAGEVLSADYLPRRYVAHTNCFRSEAGSAGRDTSGMLRQHQFEKVEMVSITHPDKSEDEHARMTRCAEGILEALGLAYRTMILCTGDMGFGARRTHDIEVWLPGQDTYREISSVSTCGAFQARRMNARFRGEDGKPQFLHTLNGSGLAVGRCLIAVLENGQTEDGGVVLPQALGPWLGGKSRITPDGDLA